MIHRGRRVGRDGVDRTSKKYGSMMIHVQKLQHMMTASQHIDIEGQFAVSREDRRCSSPSTDKSYTCIKVHMSFL
jgi:hypothetical protein